MYLEAEHHAVFSPGSGLQLSDITPDRNTEIRRRLFLPDDSAVYDFENEGIRRDNVRQAIADDHQIEELFRAAARRTEIVNCVPGIGVFSLEGDAAREYIEIERTIERLTFELGVKNSGQNERCICGSGVKFKRCHGQCRVSKR